MAIHHIIPRSRGGTDEDWNLVELTEFEHAYEHALDFVLFETSPNFDCRQPGWALLPEDLRKAVLKELSSRMQGNSRAVGSGHARKGARNGMYGKEHPSRGRPIPEERRRKISEALRGKPKSEGHKKAIATSKTGKKLGPQGAVARHNKSVGAKKGWETRRRNQNNNNNR